MLANVTGAGVTFYNYGPHGGINMVAPSVNLGGVSLTAPTSGTYACILFFQDPGDTDPALIVGSSSWNTVLQGFSYFPSATVTCAASFAADYNSLIAKDVIFAALTYGCRHQVQHRQQQQQSRLCRAGSGYLQLPVRAAIPRNTLPLTSTSAVAISQ